MSKKIKEWSGKVIGYDQVGYLPKRGQFIDKELQKADNVRIKNDEPILFLPGPLHEMSLYDASGNTKRGAFYTLVLFGVLESGKKITVVIEDIYPYFAVRIPESEKATPGNFQESLVEKLSRNYDTKIYKSRIEHHKRYMGYENEEHPYVILEFAKTNNRKKALNLIKTDYKYETGWDDASSYYRVVSRDNKLSLTQWLQLSDYRTDDDPAFKDGVVKVSYRDISNYTGKKDRPTLIKDRTLCAYWDIETYARDHSVPKHEKKDTCMFQLSLVFCWANEPSYLIQYLITTRPVTSRDGFVSILCDNESQIILVMGKILEMMQPEFLCAFNCGNYDWPWLIGRAKRWSVLREFYESVSMLNPYKTQSDEDILKYNFVSENIKIEADLFAKEQMLIVPGFQSLDVQTMFRQLHPTDGQWSLEYFLKKCNLQGKKEMTPAQIFQTYEDIEHIQDNPLFPRVLQYEKKNGLKHSSDVYSSSIVRDQTGQFTRMNKEDDNDKSDEEYESDNGKSESKSENKSENKSEGKSTNDVHTDDNEVIELYAKYVTIRKLMTDVAEYCIFDSFRCHELMIRRGILASKRTMADISYTSMFDAIYRAGGCKARNRLIGTAREKGYVASNVSRHSKSDKKYPGAYVFTPMPGVRTSKLTPEERKRKNILFAEDQKQHPDIYDESSIPERQEMPYAEWSKVSDDEIIAFKEYTRTHQEFIPIGVPKNQAKAIVREIEQTSGTQMSKCFVQYIMDPTGRPVVGLDFNSLYPSIVMTYNLSGEKMITAMTCGGLTEAVKLSKKLKAAGEDLHRIEFPYGGSPVIAWCIRHKNKQENMGIFPTVYVELFALRKKLKIPHGIYKFIMEYMIERKAAQISIYELLVIAGVKFGMNNPVTTLEILELYPSELAVQSIQERMSRFVPPVGDDKKIFLGLSKGTTASQIEEDKSTDMFLTADEVTFYCNHFDRQQNQVKLYMNTFYGESGNQLSPLYMMEIAGGITMGGQTNIKFARDRVVELGCSIEYGDSVSEDTPILCEMHGKTFYRTIDNLPREGKWQTYNGGKQIATPAKGLKVWSDTGFTKLIRIIRHETSKRMYRILTHTGYVEVTKDHSLLDEDGNEVTPEDVSVGDTLLHNDLPKASHAVKINEMCRTYKTQIEAATDYHGMSLSHGNNIIISYDKTTNMFGLHIEADVTTEIQNIEELPHATRTVYDLETESHHFAAGIGRLVVHNTDSLYLTPAEKSFAALDNKYYSGQITKSEYWTGMVKVTFAEIETIQNIVNKKLEEDNGTKSLKMGYEEVLFPYLLQRKKKYGGIQHIEIINFIVTKLKELFMRGIDAKRRGISILSVRATERIMLDIFNMNNLLTLRELALREIDSIYTDFKAGKLSIDDFIKSAKYQFVSPQDRLDGKGNKSMCTFADRMLERNTPLTLYTRVAYVIARKYPSKYDYKGRKKALSTGERMETVEYVTSNKLEVDIDYYIVNYLCGQLAPFISYHPDFYEAPRDDSTEETKRASDASNKKARKFLKEYSKQYATVYPDRGPLIKIYIKHAIMTVRNAYDKIDELDIADVLQRDWVVSSTAKFKISFVRIAEKLADKEDKPAIRLESAKKFVDSAIKRRGKKDYLYALYKEYVTKPNSKLRVTKAKYEEKKAKYLMKLNSKVNKVISTIHKHIAIVERYSEELKIMCKIDQYISNTKKRLPRVSTIYDLLEYAKDHYYDFEDDSGNNNDTKFNIEDELEKFEQKVEESITEFINDEYYRDGISTLVKSLRRIIDARIHLNTVEAIADYITKKIKKDNGINEPDEDELKDYVKQLADAINRGDTLSTSNGNHEPDDSGSESDHYSKHTKDEYRSTKILTDKTKGDNNDDDTDYESDRGDWGNGNAGDDGDGDGDGDNESDHDALPLD